MIEWLKYIVRSWGCEHCEKMHRRAQAAESAAAKVIRQNDTTRLWNTVASLKHYCENQRRMKRLWLARYRELKAAQSESPDRSSP